jgi:putative ABC transport system permease protein
MGTAEHTIHLIGWLTPAMETPAGALDNLLVTDIATAQEILGMTGRLSHIDLILPGQGPELARIQALLPENTAINSTGAQSRAIQQMTRAFQINLVALSLLALLVGAFLIYNTMGFVVVQRRSLIGVLRAIGVSRSQVFLMILVEALVLGTLGTAMGIGLGIGLGEVLTGVVTRTINDLYFVTTVREAVVAPFTLAKGVMLGMTASLLAALAPALEAAGIPPRLAMVRSHLESRLNRLLTPSLVVVFIQGLARLASRQIGIFGRLALGSITASLSRTAVAIAALMVAIATVVGIGLMIGSFRLAVSDWLGNILRADLYVSSPARSSGAPTNLIDRDLARRLSEASGVAAVSHVLRLELTTAEEITELVAYQMAPRSYGGFRFLEGDPARLWHHFEEAEMVIVSEPYAYHHGLHAGDAVTLRTDRGTRTFTIAGVYVDYSSDRGVVAMSRRTFDRYWNVPGLSSIGVYARPGVDDDSLRATIQGLLDPRQALVIHSTRRIREESMKVFDRTFAITRVLQLLAGVIAFAGVLSALLALQLERTRELGILRATGVTPGQLGGLVIAETGLMGLVAGLIALPTGVTIAALLVFVLNRRSFGWSMDLRIDPLILGQGLILAILAALLAGIIPALRMARTSPAEALRTE